MVTAGSLWKDALVEFNQKPENIWIFRAHLNGQVRGTTNILAQRGPGHRTVRDQSDDALLAMMNGMLERFETHRRI